MVKLSISLPNNTLITLDSEESELVHDVLRMLLDSAHTDASSAGMAAPVHPNRDDIEVEKGTGAAPPRNVQNSTGGQRRMNGVAVTHQANGAPPPTNGVPSYGDGVGSISSNGDIGDDRFHLARYSEQAREDFTAFCQSINPTGDMRRVVVAAEAATRFFGLEGVTADELGELFDLIGWRRANSFTQTIRNAARAKFRWLERIPGRSGRYAATEFGRSITLSG